MFDLKAAAATVLVVGSLGLATTAHGKDPQMMTHAEWNGVKSGMTRSTVNSVCGCLGSLHLDLGAQRIYRYLTPVGYADVTYTQQSGVWRADINKLFCIDGHQACEAKPL